MKNFFAFVFVMTMSTIAFAHAAYPVVSLEITGETAEADGWYYFGAGVYDLELVVGRNSYVYGETPYPAFDGYQVSSLAINITTSNCYLQVTDDGLDFTEDVIKYGAGVTAGVNNSLELIQAVSLSDMGPGFVIAYNFQLVWDGIGLPLVDMSLAGLSEYREYSKGTGAEYIAMTEDCLGDLIVIPEPMTMFMLGFGGLLALRRRRQYK